MQKVAGFLFLAVMTGAFTGCSSSASAPSAAQAAQPAAEFVLQLRPVLAGYSEWKRDFLRLLTVAASLRAEDAVTRIDEIAAKAAATERALAGMAPPSDADAGVARVQWLAAARVNQRVLALYRESLATGRGVRVDQTALQTMVEEATAAEERADAALTALKARYKIAP